MAFRRKVEGVTVALLLAMLCSAQERFESGWLKGFTKSPTEHIIDQPEKAFTVSTAKGVVLDPSGAALRGVLVEVQDAAGRIRAAKTDSNGRFELHGLRNGSYRFKVTFNGFQSVVGEIIVSRKARRSEEVTITMKFGV
jgi:hypothetical protein